MRIYFDHAATTPVDRQVLDVMIPYFNQYFGNASSLHQFGQEAHESMDRSRKIIANKINANYTELIFTSGGTESDNLAIKGISRAIREKTKKSHIITSKIEHHAVLNSIKTLEQEGFQVTYLDVDAEGFIDLEQLEKAILPDTILVSIMQANNEIGTIQDLKAIGEMCKENHVFFHSDAVQAFTKVPLDVKKFHLDLLSLTAHKIYGPKGIGALYISQELQDQNLIQKMNDGGGHEFNLRAGTENIPGMVGFAKAVDVTTSTDIDHMKYLRNYIIKSIINEIPDSRLNGPNIETKSDKRLCNNINISFKEVDGSSLLYKLDEVGIAVSTGAACIAESIKPSHILQAIGLTPDQGLFGTIRASLGKENTKAEANYFIEQLQMIINELRQK
ncbi:MAG: cysteine desulfurase family protein [Candidatus Helarchaeota archaeon]